MTGSFLLAGQIEEQLRWLVAQRLDLRAARDACHVGPEDMPGDAAVDLTMGGLQRILENPGNWTKVGIQYDRATFCKEMDAVRNIRNAVMHFRENPDAAQFMRLKRFAAVVQRAYLALAG